MNKIFKGIKVGDKVFSYYHQKWGKVIDCWSDEFLVSYILDRGAEDRYGYAYDGSGWLSANATQEVFTEEIPPLPADDLSNLRVGDKVFAQPYQKWGVVTEILPADVDIIVKVTLRRGEDRYLMVTNTGLDSEDHKAPIVLLKEVPQPLEIQRVFANYKKSHHVTFNYKG